VSISPLRPLQSYLSIDAMKSPLAFGLLASASVAAGKAVVSSALPLTDLSYLVAFGDSYTDEHSVVNNTATSTGGKIWPRFVATWSGSTLFDYARSGATCTNAYRPAYAATNAVVENELPPFLEDVEDPTLYGNVTATNTAYALWIGTNDLGARGWLTQVGPTGYNLTSLIDCTWGVLDTIYNAGGRYFVVMNTAPLQFSPEYGLPGQGSVGSNHYFEDKVRIEPH
jgi:phospholipase/lecithinase/hemolysin